MGKQTLASSPKIPLSSVGSASRYAVTDTKEETTPGNVKPEAPNTAASTATTTIELAANDTKEIPKEGDSEAKGDAETTKPEELADFANPLGIFGPQLQQRATEDICFAMGMTTEEVQKLVAIFNDIDVNCSGLINLREFYFLLDTPQNKYTTAILKFGAHKSDPVKLDIDDFIGIICTFVLMSQEDVVKFCFETFDEDDSGALSKDEFMNMCDSIQIKGDGFFEGNFKKAMEAFDTNHDGLLDIDEFMAMTLKFPLVFWPLFYFQEIIQEKTLGKKNWLDINKRQKKITAWRAYMKRYLGRAPPRTWMEKYFSCITNDNKLRLIASQLYDQDLLKMKLEAMRGPSNSTKTESNRKLKQSTSSRRSLGKKQTTMR